MPNTPPAASGSNTTPELNPDTVRADANAAVSEIQGAAKKVADEAGARAGELAEQAKTQISQATDAAKEAASGQKQVLADQVGGVAEAMQKAASELEADNGAGAQYARYIADNAEKLSTTLRDSSIDELIGIAQDFGRKQPAAFVGAAALLGFAASRFIMASAKRPADPAPAPTSDRNDWAAGNGFGTTDRAGV